MFNMSIMREGYQILRVPEKDDYYKWVYDLIKAQSGDKVNISIDEFKKYAVNAYMIGDEYEYFGVGFLYKIPDSMLMSLNIVVFNEEDEYNKSYRLIKVVSTIGMNYGDKTIFCRVQKDNKSMINALRNNGFKRVLKDSSPLYDTWYKTAIGNRKIDESKWEEIDPKNLRLVIDKYTKPECTKEEHNIQEAQDVYTENLLKENMTNPPVVIYDENPFGCCSKQKGQTEEEFLQTDGCKMRGRSKPYIYCPDAGIYGEE